jgi:hypothetical protein
MSGMPTQPKDFVSSKDIIPLIIINRKKSIGVKEKGLEE